MDCQLALTTLDAGRPDRSDWDAPELRAAAAHVAQCAGCQAELSDRAAGDVWLTEVFGGVEIPAGLQQRLLQALSAEQVGSQPSVGPRTISRPLRRWWLGSCVAAGLVLLTGWWLSGTATSPLSLQEVYAQLLSTLPRGGEADVTATPVSIDPELDLSAADPVWGEVVAGSMARPLDLDGRPGAEAAAYRFGTRRTAGWLIVLPRSRVADAPEVNVPMHAHFSYGPRPHVAWSTPTQVYVCILDRGTLDDLRRDVYGYAA